MIKYIGWDVGIKNLSYCIIDHEYNIIDWNIINLLDDEEKVKQECSILKKTGDKCDKKVFYIDYTDNIDDIDSRKYFCKTHSKKKMGIKEIDICYNCNSKAKFILDNNVYSCKLHSKDKNIKEKICTTKTNKIDLDVLGKSMINKLDKNKLFLDVDYVLIENQPVLKNPRMKSIQMMLFTYFLIKKPYITIKFVSASSKLAFKINNEEIEKINKIKNKYDKRKKLSIEYCKHFINSNDSKNNFFVNFKKKDDLADAYLLARKYIENIKCK
jgi:hypothetical protein